MAHTTPTKSSRTQPELLDQGAHRRACETLPLPDRAGVCLLDKKRLVLFIQSNP